MFESEIFPDKYHNRVSGALILAGGGQQGIAEDALARKWVNWKDGVSFWERCVEDSSGGRMSVFATAEGERTSVGRGQQEYDTNSRDGGASLSAG